jgi:predicted Zn-dependent protease
MEETKTPLDPLKQLESILEQWTRTPIGRRAFLASLPLLMAACATGSKHRYREGDNTGQTAALTPEEELKLTREALPEFNKQYPPVQDEALNRYLASIGQKIVSANKLEGNPYHYTFQLVRADFVNAFALPAGMVFVTTPLFQMTESEAELAGVLGHEIGHIKARHTAERMAAAKRAQGKSWLYGAAGGILGGAAGFGLGKLLCRKEDRTCLAKATGAGIAAGASGGLLVQKFAFMANSREDEMEADRIGFRTSVAAGYSKDHVGLFYEKLLRMEQSAKQNRQPILAALQDAMSTHPPSQERVNQMRQMSAETPAQIGARVSSNDFEEMKKRLKAI